MSNQNQQWPFFLFIFFVIVRPCTHRRKCVTSDGMPIDAIHAFNETLICDTNSCPCCCCCLPFLSFFFFYRDDCFSPLRSKLRLLELDMDVRWIDLTAMIYDFIEWIKSLANCLLCLFDDYIRRLYCRSTWNRIIFSLWWVKLWLKGMQ